MSFTISSLIVSGIGFLLQQSGAEVAPENVQNFIEVGLQIIGAIGIYWGRYRQGDITIFGTKA